MVLAALCSPPVLAIHTQAAAAASPRKVDRKNLTVARADWSAGSEAAPQPISVRRVVYESGTLKRGRRGRQVHQVGKLHM